MLRVYLETTIAGYLTARSTRDLIFAARQEVTREWWGTATDSYELFVSELVVRECSRGDSDFAAKRLSLIEGIPVLEICEESIAVGESLLGAGLVPEKAAQDALHIGIATVQDMDVLLTWNCSHLANGSIMRRLSQHIRGLGYEPPAICTPEEMLGA